MSRDISFNEVMVILSQVSKSILTVHHIHFDITISVVKVMFL